MTVNEVMTRYVVRVSCADTLARAAELMRKNRIGALPVIRDRAVVGVVTDRDLVTRGIALGRDPARTSVERVMSRPALCIESGLPVTEALALLTRYRIKRLPVLKDETLVGMVSLCDLPRSVSPETVVRTYCDIFAPGAADAGNSFFQTLFP